MIQDMTEEETKRWNSYKTWGEEYADKQILIYRQQRQADEYIKENLERVPEASNSYSPYGRYRGYTEGTITYRRQDGQPITQDDVFHLNNLVLGQVTYCRSHPGEDVAVVKFTCDSTD